MPVVNLKSDLYRDELAGADIPDFVRTRGRIYVVHGRITNAADDSDGSTYKMCTIPANSILLPTSYLDVEHWGFAAVRVGTLTDVDAWVSQTQATENIISPVSKGGIGFGKQTWDRFDLAEDPGGMLDIYAHAIADAASAGHMDFMIEYVHN